jgi:SAM-dependent methyltransferase
METFNAVKYAHHLWEKLVKPGDLVVDATCGNGKDTLVLARLIGETGTLIGLDIQEAALTQTRTLLEKELPRKQLDRISLLLQSHETFPSLAEKPKLIVYNLGYLPGGDKKITTEAETTLKSLKESLLLVGEGGAISLACYPGHDEGLREELALLEWMAHLPPSEWSVSLHRCLNRHRSPFLFWIQKISLIH